MRKLLAVLFSVVLLYSCKKKEGCNGSYAEIDAHYLSYWFFPDSSYWIYKAKDTSLYDTVRVIRSLPLNQEYFDNGKDDIQYGCYVNYTENLNHSYYNKPDEREQFFADGKKNDPKPLLTYRTKMKKNFPIYLYNEKASHKDSLEVAGKTYKDVLIFNEPQRVVFSSGVGIIEIQSEDSLLWELIEYKIGD